MRFNSRNSETKFNLKIFNTIFLCFQGKKLAIVKKTIEHTRSY